MQSWMTWLSLMVSVILAFQCSQAAKRKGRNPHMWFMAGSLFGLLALLVLLFLPKKRVVVSIVPEQQTFFLPCCIEQQDHFWYFLDETKVQKGPMSFHALRAAWDEGAIGEKTFVWNEAMTEWQRLHEVVSLKTS